MRAATEDTSPLAGLRVVEVALDTTVVGAGMATCLPGALLRDLGAEVVRVQSDEQPSLDAGVQSARPWNRGKEIVEVDVDDAARAVRPLVEGADVLLASGPEALIERQGLGWASLGAHHPRLVHVRIRPSADAGGVMDDLELLVAARAGLLTQIRHHRGHRPVCNAVPVAQAGAALSATVGALARLLERERTGAGGWAETSLLDGLAAMLPMILGRVERDSPATTLLWRDQGPDAGLAYRCADDEWLQLWFGARGAYESFLEAMGDEPSEHGYQADLTSGEMTQRSARWAETFSTRTRADWLEAFEGELFRCEPVLRPGEILADGHARETGLSTAVDSAEVGPTRMVGPVLSVAPRGGRHDSAAQRSGPLLEGIRVLDLSAYLAGPVAPLVLAELGADVVKVEPVTGDPHRSMHPMYAAGQRGKRAVALDLKSTEAPDLLRRLFGWADVVHHNARLGLSEKLGYDEDTVRSSNPGAVYSFASGFGEAGPRASLAANDHLMQALSGTEAAQGGHGNPPTFLAWGAIDVADGWLAACGILAGLFARRRTGRGQSVATSLLGAGMLLTSGAHVVADVVERGPVLDAGQNGYGATYRLYACADDTWLALAVPDAAAWTRLRDVVAVADLPASPPPLRHDGLPQPEEEALASLFATAAAPAWVDALRAAGVPAEAVADLDRSDFVRRYVDDPVNRQLGRVVTYSWGELGRVDQPTFPPRVGPSARRGASADIAGLGAHTAEVLAEVGVDEARIEALVEAGVVAS